jgi:hypothetical protein
MKRSDKVNGHRKTSWVQALIYHTSDQMQSIRKSNQAITRARPEGKYEQSR